MRLVDEEHPRDGGMTALGDSKMLSRLAATRGGPVNELSRFARAGTGRNATLRRAPSRIRNRR